MTEEHEKTPDANLGGRARTAAGWQFLSKGINSVLQMVTSIVLARLLMPADFGVVAMATMITGLAGMFRELGLGQALVQRQEIADDHTRSAFWGTLVMALMLYAGVFLAAPYVGGFFDEPRMVPVLKVIALMFAIAPFAVVPRSLLQRKLDFRTPFFAELSSSVAYGVAGITMALLGYGYWSLVGASLASSVVNTTVLCILTRYLPPLVPTFRGLRDLYGFGIGATGVGLMGYTAQQVDYFVIGRWLDSAALGLYEKAFRLVHAPLRLIGGIVSPVLFPLFSRLQEQHVRAREIIGKVLTAVGMLTFPSLALFGVTAPELIPLLLGEQWTDAVIPAQIMCAAGALRALINPSAMLPKGFGAIYSQVWRNGVYAATLFGGAIIGSRWGIVGVAWAALFATIVIWSLNTQLLYACSGFGLRQYGSVLFEPLLMTVVLIPLTALTRSLLLAHGHEPLSVLVATILVGGAVIIGLLFGVCGRSRTIGRELLSMRRAMGTRS